MFHVLFERTHAQRERQLLPKRSARTHAQRERQNDLHAHMRSESCSETNLQLIPKRSARTHAQRERQLGALDAHMRSETICS